MAGHVDVDGRRALQRVLERPDVGAARDQLDNVLGARVLRRQLVADVAPQTPRIVTHAVGARVLGRRRGYGWAHGPGGLLISIVL